VRFDDGAKLNAVWRSKVFRQERHENFGFAQIICRAYSPAPTLRVYADGVLRYTKLVTSPNEFRLPAGFKQMDWEIEIETQVDVLEAFVATSALELQSA
jgi:hypothetical protein